MRRPQIVRVHVLADANAQRLASVLVRAEVDPAVDPRVGNVVRDIRQGGIFERHSVIHQRDRERTIAVDLFQHCARGIAQCAVSRWIAGKAGRPDERPECGVGLRTVVAVRGSVGNGSFRSPEIVSVLHVERRDGGVADGHIDKGEIARVLSECLALRGTDLSGGSVEHAGRSERRVEDSHVRAVWRPRCAIDVANLLYLIEGPSIPLAVQRRRRVQVELARARDAEWRHILPMEKRATRRGAIGR